jgi:benzylsuccinate CoA-transferase BbsF subunit
MLSSCLCGQTGPLRRFAGLGNMGAALSGFYPIVGWPDRPPAGPYMAYSDYTAPRLAASALLGALEWRRRTGEGQYLDFSQLEAALHFLAPAILDQQVNGRDAGRCGNDDRTFAPHGVYPTTDEGRWVAVACDRDEQWSALATEIGRAELAGLPAEARRERRTEIDAAIEAWTTARTGETVQSLLQSRGVPAHAIQHSADCVADPQLKHRGHFIDAEHARWGTTFVEAPGFRLSRTPGRVHRAGPTLGEDNEHVLAKLLGYSNDRIAEIVLSGALQ